MPQTKQQIQALLADAATSPRYRFGQNFMIDGNLVSIVAEAGELTKSDLVIEVGPGTGTLTEELLLRAGRVVAVEIDRDLSAMLRRHLAHRPTFQLIEGDALASKHQLNPELLSLIEREIQQGTAVKLVANLPYNIASPLIIELLIAGVSRLAFTVQKEVGQRLKAAAGGDDYGPLTVTAQVLAEVKMLRVLPAQAFWPAPKIESALISMQRRGSIPVDPRAFATFVQKVFASRRKMLRRALLQAGMQAGDELLASISIRPDQRPETLAPEQFVQLYRALKVGA
jgi:16S rRNA (adenine1518-N6/adenine1519-N6)-dimethyltransferase